MIVLGGTFAATLIAYPWKKVIWTIQLLKKAFLARNEMDWMIDKIVDLTRAYRQGGIRALEQQEERLPQGLLRTSIGLMALHYPKERIEQMIHKEAQFTYVQYQTAYKILYSMARLAPALGLAGTIVALIRVFGHITDPKSLVAYMGIALLSTFYGVVIANLCFVPLSNKVMEFMDHEEVLLDLIQEGILDLHDQENPWAIRYKLEALSNKVTKPEPAWRRPKLFLRPSKEETASASSWRS
jgi:chemotaxis protein MotA